MEIHNRKLEIKRKNIFYSLLAISLCLVIFLLFLPRIISGMTEPKEEITDIEIIEPLIEPQEDEPTEQVEMPEELAVEEVEEEEPESEPEPEPQIEVKTEVSSTPTIAAAPSYELSAITGRWDNDYNYYSIPLSAEDQDYLRQLCQNYDVSFRVMLGLIQIESYYNPNSLSSTNDYGICQINKCHHQWLSEVFGQTDFFDMHFNMECGVYMISRYLDKGYCIEQTLMGYNLSERGMLNKWNNGIHHTYYSDKILAAANNLY